MADEVSIMTDIVKDPLQLEGGMLYDGRYPKHVDEVAVGGNVLRYLDKKIGDTIHIKQGDTEKEFLITGTIQSFNNQGMIGLMTNDGITSIQSDFQSDTLYIYLNDSEDVKAFIENVKTTEGDIFGNTIDMQELIDSQLGSLGSIFGAVTLAILMITILVVILVLYMVIKATILRRKREFGIQKALGFTTLQLMNQIALHFTPTILIGVVIGGIAGYNGFNPIFTVLTSSAGIMTADMPSPLGWTIVTCLVLVGLAYAVSILVAWRIRKISAYGLINE